MFLMAATRLETDAKGRLRTFTCRVIPEACGIYLVGWFHCERWKKKQAEQRKRSKTKLNAQIKSLWVIFPAACGVEFMDERIYSQESQRYGFDVSLGISGKIQTRSF
jgi:hypothetical protein